MQEDFHYYATYCAAYISGYSHEESMAVCYSAQLVDLCTRAFLSHIGAPGSAATTQLQMELMNANTDIIGLQDITRIWASFHFLPGDLHAAIKKGSKNYRDKFRLICDTNGQLLADTIELVKSKSLQAVGLAMHILADTWAHRYFAGTPSLVINNTNYYFYEMLPSDNGYTERPVTFRHNPSAPDDLEKGIFSNSIFQSNERSIMNLGHGRAGHLPDYSFIRYKYLPAWGGFREMIKDNPSDYYHAFCQMVYALQYLRTGEGEFELNTYAWDTVEPYKDRIQSIIGTRRLSASDDWRAFGKELSGHDIEDFDLEKYCDEYKNADKDNKEKTTLGQFILASLAQKSMVTNKIFTSGNLLAGFSVDFKEKGFAGIKDYGMLVKQWQEDMKR